MPPVYADKSTSIKPYILSSRQHAAIGRLIRACAEIEDIINLRLANLASVPEGTVLLFLGQTSLRNRLQVLKLISQGKGVEVEQLFEQAFDNPDYRDLQEMRNTLAHGRLLGLTEEGRVAFAVNETQGIESTLVHMNVNSYEPGAFAEMAHMAEDIIPQMEEAFGLTALRETRRTRELAPHSKTWPKEMQGSELARQRRASQASDKAEKLARKEAQRSDPKNRTKKNNE